MTPSNKVEILSERLRRMGYDALPVYREPAESPLGDLGLSKMFPLVLTTGAKLGCYVHSQMRTIPSLNRRMPHNVAEIHPDTAAAFGVAEADTALLESPRAHIQCRVRLTEDVRPQVVQLFHGFEEANANLLTNSASHDPITGSVPMRSSLCRIRKA